jgi:NitT/TauT family transport system substrate-binding protein
MPRPRSCCSRRVSGCQASQEINPECVVQPKAYRETVSYLYTDPNALKVYSDWLKISEAKAKRTRDDFFPRASIEPDKIVGLDTIVKDAVTLKYTATELTKAQLDDLIQIPPR